MAQVIQALAQYNTDLANLERDTGTILDQHGVRFLEERFRAIGPFSRIGPSPAYPASVAPGPNVDRYPVGAEPAERALEKDRPTVPK